MITRRRLVIALGAGALAAPLASFAQQQPAKVPRVGILGAAPGPQWDTFKQGLRDLGYSESRNIALEYRWTEGKNERLPALAAELIGLRVDIIVAEGTPATQAAKKATGTIPIVMAIVGDPVGVGLVTSLVRPGGNITGSSSMSPDLSAKQMELLKEVVPSLTHLAILRNPANQSTGLALKGIETAARVLRVHLIFVEARGRDEFEKSFSTVVRERAGGLLVIPDPTFDAEQSGLADFASKNRLPALYNKTLFAEAGGLMSYGARYSDFFGRAAIYVDKILKGAKPAELPIEQPTRFELVINMKTAKALGIKIPNSILVRANRVIE